MSNIHFRLARSLIKPSTLKKTAYRCLSTTPFQLASKTTKPELLPDIRLQELVAELERPLNLKSVSIDDNRENLLSSIESFRPKLNILPTVEIEKLISILNRSYTVSQLTAYVKAHHIPGKGTKKQQLMERIINQHWSIRSLEKVREEQIEKKKNRVSESLPATIQDLFFVIGEQGETMKKIEESHDVNIIVDVEKSVYILEGGPQSVLAAKKEVESRLKVIKEETVDLPKKAKENSKLRSEIGDALIDISKVAGSFISLKDDKVHIASISNEKMEDAKRLLSLLLTELDATDKTPFDKADQIYVHSFPEYTVLPLYDYKSMPHYNQNLSWHRLKYDTTEDDCYKLLNEEDGVTFNKLGEDLLKPFENNSNDDFSGVSLEAKFGSLLFQNNQDKGKNYYKLKSANLADLLTNTRTSFFSAHPPSQITTPFIPLTLENGFHERSIKLEYVDKSLVYDFEGDNKDLERLQVEFKVHRSRDIELKSIIGEKNRRTIDILGAHGQIDIRLIARNYVNYSGRLGNLLEQCKLLSHNELEAPKNYENLLLSDITFMNKKRYLLDDNLITIQHVEQQDKRSKRTELIVSSVDPKTLDITNSIQRWPSFSSVLAKVASQWHYVSTSKLT